MATLEKLRENSKPVIWFVIIAFVVGLAGVGIFNYISNNKLTIFGMSSPNRYSMSIENYPIEHVDNSLAGNQNGLDYLRTFYGFKSASALTNQSSTSLYSASPFNYHDIDIYTRHIQTEDELKGRVLTDIIYNNLFQNELSDIDILMFLKTEIETRQPSNVGNFSPISRIVNSFLNETYFIGFEEPFTDLPDGQWDRSEAFVDINNNNWKDPGESFTDSKGNGIRDNDTYTDMNDNGIWDEGDVLGLDRNQNGIWESEDFEDLKNGIWDEGEEFTDALNEKYDEGEEFTDKNGNGIWDEGEEFTDALNEKYDEGEEFTDGDGVWDNGLNKWLDHCIAEEKIDYSLIYDKDIAQRLENYITSVASYHIKNKKYESVFNKIKYDPEIYKKEDYLIKNSNALIGYISYDINNIDEQKLKTSLDTEKIKTEIDEFETINLGYFSNAFLIVILILFIIFSIKNRNSRPALALGAVFSILLGLIVVFKLLSDSSQGKEKYKELSYIYLQNNSISEPFEDKGNGIWDEGEEFTDENDNGFWDQEPLTVDVNGNGIYDLEEDEFDDLNNDGKRTKEPLTDLGNGIWDEGEEFTDENGNGFWDSGESITKLEFDELLKQIENSNFKATFESFNGKKDENIILSEQLLADNMKNLGIDLSQSSFEIVDGNIVQTITNQEAQIFGSMLFELLEVVFKTPQNETFIINHINPKDGKFEGYLIGFINDEGNYFEKKEYDKIEDENLEQVLLVESSLFLEPEKLAFEISEISKSQQDSIIITAIEEEYNSINVSFGYGNETIISDALIRGYISQMEAGQTSEIIVSDNTAYVVHVLEPSTDQGLFIPDNYSFNETYDLFSSVFNNMKRNTKGLDWRNEAYYMVNTNNINQPPGKIDNIYLNLNNFEATVKSALGIIDFNVK